jgi:asparagine synthetase B (glutamine-hydrolysing)
MSVRGELRSTGDVDGTRRGPARVYCRVRLGPDAPQMTGTPSWRGGTPVLGPDGDADGVFGGWDYDEGVVRVFTDRLAFFPLYYFATATEFCVSPNLITLLEEGAPRTIDDEALAVFLRTGWFLGDDTAFASIRAVPPAHRFVWDAGTLTVERAARSHDEIAITRADAIDGYIELFRAAVARRLTADGTPFVMPLSGGADSRHILLELVRQGHPPTGVLTGTQRPRCPDVAVASVLAERLGIAHTVVHGAMDGGWSQELCKNVETNFCADEHVWYLPVADHLLRNTHVSYDGIAGDVLSANGDLTETVLRGMRAGRVDELLDDVMNENHSEDVLRDALTHDFYARIPETVARERVAEEVRRHLDASNPYSSFHFDNYDRREVTLNAHATLAAIHVQVPFLDRDLVDFLTTLPAELLFGGRFHVETIRAAYPDVADVRFAKELPRSPKPTFFDRVRRTPAHLLLHTEAHAGHGRFGRARSAWLRAVPPVVRHPGRPGSLGTFNRRAAWLRQIEMLASGTLPLP